jgi:hypothetical protein
MLNNLRRNGGIELLTALLRQHFNRRGPHGGTGTVPSAGSGDPTPRSAEAGSAEKFGNRIGSSLERCVDLRLILAAGFRNIGLAAT